MTPCVSKGQSIWTGLVVLMNPAHDRLRIPLGLQRHLGCTVPLGDFIEGHQPFSGTRVTLVEGFFSKGFRRLSPLSGVDA